MTLSREKFASRVVEKAVITMQNYQLDQLCAVFQDKHAKKLRLFRELLFDPYGNYIATKLIEQVKLYGLKKHLDHFFKTFNESLDVLQTNKNSRLLVQKILDIQHGGKKKKAKGGGPSSSSSSVTSKVSNQMSQSSSSI